MNRAALRWAGPLVLVLALTSCEEDTSPVISKFKITPECGVMTEHVRPIFDDNGNLIGQEDLGTYLEVDFFARARGGNEKPDPTGANTPLDWTWDFGDGGSVGNVVTGTYRYTEAGIYTITLRVTDEDGDEDTISTTITVGALGSDVDVLEVAASVVGDPVPIWSPVTAQCPAQPPGVVRITDWAFVGYQFSFSGSLTTPCEVDGLTEQYTWTWNFGDGNETRHEGEPRHTFVALGSTFDVTLSVLEEVSQTMRSAMVQVTTPTEAPTEKPDLTQCPTP